MARRDVLVRSTPRRRYVNRIAVPLDDAGGRSCGNSRVGRASGLRQRTGAWLRLDAFADNLALRYYEAIGFEHRGRPPRVNYQRRRRSGREVDSRPHTNEPRPGGTE